MIRDDLIRIVKIFQNNGFDEVTNKKATEDEIADFMDYFDDNVKHKAGVELVFDLEKYGLSKNATAEEIDSVGGTTCMQFVFSIASLFFPVTFPLTIIPGETQFTVIL